MPTYYVSTSGNDGNPGTSEAAPWKTVAKVNAFALQPDDVVRFKRGEIWQETLSPSTSGTAGHPITFTAYGTGERPIISAGTTLKSTVWAADGGGFNVYSTGLVAESASNVWVWQDGVRMTPVGSLGACQSTPGSSYYNGTTTIYIHASDNSSPITNGKTYIAGQRLRGIYANSKSRLVFDGLRSRYHCGQQGNFEINGSDCVVRDCYSDQGGYHGMLITGARCLVGNEEDETGGECYIGASQSGSIVFFTGADGGVCRGNTIEQTETWSGWCCQFHGTTDGVLYERNLVKRPVASAIFTGAFALNDATAKNITMRHNRIEGYHYHVLYLFGGIVTGVKWLGNVSYVPNIVSTAINITGGSTLSEYHGNTLYVGNVDKQGLTVDATSTISAGRNNVLWTGWPVWQTTGGTIAGLNYNRYYSHRASPFSRNGAFTDFAGWQAASGQDANSTFGDPLFTNAASGDLTPADLSPLLGAGLDLGDAYVTAVASDATFPLEPDELQDQAGNWNIGAYVLESADAPVPTGDHYTTAEKVELSMLGRDNRTDATDGDRDGEEDDGQMEDSLTQGDAIVNLILKTHSPPPLTYNVESTDAAEQSIIETAATLIVTGIQFNKRDHQVHRTNDAPTRGDHLITEGRQMILDLVASGLVGVELADEDETPAAGTLEFVPINRDVCTATSDENTRPVLWY